jgi:AcrR family transcriptional regulator
MSIQMTISLHEKTNALRRQHILDAAADVFSERGFNRASIRDIATAAGVADGTIYNVFENKDALLLALLDALAAAPAEPAVSPDLLRSDPPSFLKQLLEQRWKAYTPRTMAILRVAISQALVDPAIRKRFFEIFLAPALKGIEPLVGPVFDDSQANTNCILTTPRLVVASIIGLNVLALLDDGYADTPQSTMIEPLAEMFWRGLGRRGEPTVAE